MTPGRPASTDPAPARLAVMVSGAGTILEAMVGAGVTVSLVVADRPCTALDRAHAAGLPTCLIARTAFGWPDPNWDRSGFTAAIITELRAHHIGLVAMAGFMTVLGPALFAAYPDRVLNTHPSLLPAFQGAHAVADALAAGASITGCTVHLATAQLDAGPILAQANVSIHPNDTPATLQERIKVVERQLYPRIIREQQRKWGGPHTEEPPRVEPN